MKLTRTAQLPSGQFLGTDWGQGVSVSAAGFILKAIMGITVPNIY